MLRFLQKFQYVYILKDMNHLALFAYGPAKILPGKAKRLGSFHCEKEAPGMAHPESCSLCGCERT